MVSRPIRRRDRTHGSALRTLGVLSAGEGVAYVAITDLDSADLTTSFVAIFRYDLQTVSRKRWSFRCVSRGLQ